MTAAYESLQTVLEPCRHVTNHNRATPFTAALSSVSTRARHALKFSQNSLINLIFSWIKLTLSLTQVVGAKLTGVAEGGSRGFICTHPTTSPLPRARISSKFAQFPGSRFCSYTSRVMHQNKLKYWNEAKLLPGKCLIFPDSPLAAQTWKWNYTYECTPQWNIRGAFKKFADRHS